eukprot:CFRG1298T1
MEQRMVGWYRILDQSKNRGSDVENPRSDVFSAKRRLDACRQLASALSETRYKQAADFPKFLSIAVSGLLLAFNDTDSNVRLAADESLNWVLRSNLDMHQGRLQLELYKEIKKTNAPVRSLRAAMLKFSELSRMTKPAKRRVFLNSLIGPLVNILGRTDSDLLQDTLQPLILNVCKEYGLFFTSSQTKILLDACLKNLKHNHPVVRRTAAACVGSICSYCAGVEKFLPQFLRDLADKVMAEGVSETDILGVYECLSAIFGDKRSKAFAVTIVMLAYEDTNTSELQENSVLHSLKTIKVLFLHALRHGSQSNANLTNAALRCIEHILLSYGSAIFYIAQHIPKDECLVSTQQVLDVMFRWLIHSDEDSVMKTRVSVKTLALRCISAVVSADHSALDLNIDTLMDVFQYYSHYDPAVRGNVALLLGQCIETALSRPHVRQVSQDKTDVEDRNVKVRSMVKQCVTMLLALLADTSSQAQKSACLSAGGCVGKLLSREIDGHNFANDALQLVTTVCSLLRNDTYWLVQLEALNALSSVDWMSVNYWLDLVVPVLNTGVGMSDERYNTMENMPNTPDQSSKFASFTSTLPDNIQSYVVTSVVFCLDNTDARIRASAAKCLTAMCTTLYQPSIWRFQSMSAVYASHVMSETVHPLVSATNSGSFVGVLYGRDVSRVAELIGPSYTYEPCSEPSTSISKSASKIIDGNLSLIFSVIIGKLHGVVSPNNSYQSATPGVFLPTSNTIVGAFVALADLCRCYGTPALDYDFVSPCSEDLAISSSRSLLGYLSDVLLLTLDLISCSDLCVDLNTHPLILTLLADLCRNSKSLQFYPHTPRILAHLMRVLNVCVHVVCKIDLLPPGSEQFMPTNIKKEVQTDTEQRLAENMCAFFSLPAYVNLYHQLKRADVGANTSLSGGDRVGSLVSSTLYALATLIGSIQTQIAPFSELLLKFLHVMLPVAGPAVISCLHELIKALMPAPYERTLIHSQESVASVPDAGRSQSEFDAWVGEQLMTTLDSTLRRKESLNENDDTNETISCSQASNVNKSMRRLPSWPFGHGCNGRGDITGKGNTQSAHGKVPKARFVRLIEPLLSKMLGIYVLTSSIEYQKTLLALLARLLSLGLNYQTLDQDKVYITFFQQQMELVITGQQPRANEIVPYMFQFFVLISKDAQKYQEVVSFARTIQLVERLLASAVHKETPYITRQDKEIMTLHALKPIVAEILLFEPDEMPSFPSSSLPSPEGPTQLCTTKNKINTHGYRAVLSPLQESAFSLLLRCLHRNYALAMATLLLKQAKHAKAYRSMLSARIWGALVTFMLGTNEKIASISHNEFPVYGDWTLEALYNCLECLDLCDYKIVVSDLRTVMGSVQKALDIGTVVGTRAGFEVGSAKQQVGSKNLSTKALLNIALTTVAVLRCWCRLPEAQMAELPVDHVLDIFLALITMAQMPEPTAHNSQISMDVMITQVLLLCLYLQEKSTQVANTLKQSFEARDANDNLITGVHVILVQMHTSSSSSVLLWLSLVLRALPPTHNTLVKQINQLLNTSTCCKESGNKVLMKDSIQERSPLPSQVMIVHGSFLLLCESFVRLKLSSRSNSETCGQVDITQHYPLWTHFVVKLVNEPSVQSLLSSNCLEDFQVAILCQTISHGISGGWHRALILNSVKCITIVKPRIPEVDDVCAVLIEHCKYPSIRRSVQLLMKPSRPQSAHGNQQKSMDPINENLQDSTNDPETCPQYIDMVLRFVLRHPRSRAVRQAAQLVPASQLMDWLVNGRVSISVAASLVQCLLDVICTRNLRLSPVSDMPAADLAMLSKVDSIDDKHVVDTSESTSVALTELTPEGSSASDQSGIGGRSTGLSSTDAFDGNFANRGVAVTVDVPVVMSSENTKSTSDNVEVNNPSTSITSARAIDNFKDPITCSNYSPTSTPSKTLGDTLTDVPYDSLSCKDTNLDPTTTAKNDNTSDTTEDLNAKSMSVDKIEATMSIDANPTGSSYVDVHDVHLYVQSKIAEAIAVLSASEENILTVLSICSSVGSICLCYFTHSLVMARAISYTGVVSLNNGKNSESVSNDMSVVDNDDKRVPVREELEYCSNFKKFSTLFATAASASLPETRPYILVCALECLSESYKHELEIDEHWPVAVNAVFSIFQHVGLAPPLRPGTKIDPETDEECTKTPLYPFPHDVTHHRLGIMLEIMCSSLTKQPHHVELSVALLRSLRRAVVQLCRVDMMTIHSHMLCIKRGEMYGTCQGQEFPSSLLPAEEAAHADTVLAALQTVGVLGTPTVGLFKHVWASLMQTLDAGLDVADGEKVGNQVCLAIRGLVSLLYEHAGYQVQLGIGDGCLGGQWTNVARSRQAHSPVDNLKSLEAPDQEFLSGLDGLASGMDCSDESVCLGGIACLCNGQSVRAECEKSQGSLCASMGNLDSSDESQILRTDTKMSLLGHNFVNAKSFLMLQPHLNVSENLQQKKLFQSTNPSPGPIDVLGLCKVLARRFGQYLRVVRVGVRSPLLLVEMTKAAILLGSITTCMAGREDTTIHTWLSDVYIHLSKAHSDLPRLNPYLLLGLSNAAVHLNRFELISQHIETLTATLTSNRSAALRSAQENSRASYISGATRSSYKPSTTLLQANPMTDLIGTEICLLQCISILLADATIRKSLSHLIPSIIIYLRLVLSEADDDKLISPSTSNPITQVPRFYLDVLILTLSIIQYFPNHSRINGFADEAIKVCVSITADQRTPEFVFHGIVKGLERLMLNSSAYHKIIESEFNSAEKSIGGATILRSYSSLRLSVSKLWVDKTEEIKTTNKARDVVRQLFERLHTASNLESGRLVKLLPLLLTKFFSTQDIMTNIMSEYLNCTTHNIKRLSAVILNVLAQVQHFQDHPPLNQWIVFSLKSFLDKYDYFMARATLSTLFVAASRTKSVSVMDVCVLQQLDNLELFDCELLYFAGVDFYKQLPKQNQVVFLSVLESTDRNTAFRTLAKLCLSI